MTAAFNLDFRPSPLGWLMPPGNSNREANEKIGMALRQARKKAWGVYGSLARTAEMAGVSQGTLSAIERGDHPLSKVRAENLQNFPAAYGMTSTEFAQLTGVTLVIPAENQPHPNNVRFQDNLHRVPVRNMAAAGQAFYSEVAVLDYEYVSADLYRTDMIVVEVAGDSMEPRIMDGDRVYVDTHMLDALDGRVVLAHIHGDGYVLKQIRTIGDLQILDSINPKHGAVQADRVTIIGTAYHRHPRGNSLM